MKRRSIVYWLVVLALTIAVAHELSIHRTRALAFTVTTTADNDVAPPNGSLRKAIIDANANPGLDTIQFNIAGAGVHTILIDPDLGLPAITSPVIIDGYTEGGSSVNTGTTSNNATINIVLDGSNIAGTADGLLLSSGSSGSTIKGLVIHSFPGNGIRLDSSSNKVQGCYVGISNLGLVSLPNSLNGVSVNGFDNNMIGTDGDGVNDLAEKNILSGNAVHGVFILGASSSGNIVKGNFIGVGRDGSANRGNTIDGVDIDQAINNTIGGTTPNERNIISGNGFVGVRIQGSGATGNTVQGNFIGTTADGSGALGNSSNGVGIADVASNTVGGTTATPGTGAGNVISGNNSEGVNIFGAASTGNTVAGNIIGLNSAGTTELGNSSFGVQIFGSDSNTIGGVTTSHRNVISGNSSNGIRLASADNNLIKANFIGTNAAGTAAIPNLAGGVTLGILCSNNIIGGATAPERNVISGNTTEGVEIRSSGNSVFGNYIGTDAAGDADLGNSTDGVFIDHSPDVLIGSTTAGTGNVISGNNTNGVRIIDDPSSTFTTAIRVQGNIIGLNATGTTDLGNTLDGVHIDNCNNVRVGSTLTSGRNIISGNNNHGIEILGASTGTLVEGNFIGTDISGTLDRGNTFDGVLTDASGNTIGGAGTARNIISGNAFHGVALLNVSAPGNLVQNNFIGTDVNGTNPIANTLTGVIINGVGNTLGGAAGLGNTVAFNLDDGIRVQAVGSAGNGNAIFTNSIFSNGSTSGQLGIDILPDGVTPSDNLDPDTGPNNLQNFPVLTSAVRNNGNSTTTITGLLDSTPSTNFVLQFFSNPSCDASGNGEGKTFLGSTTVTTPFDGNPVSFVIAFATAVPIGQSITATATDSGFNTSEFSACETVIGDSPTAIVFASASAIGFDDGVFIQWQTGMEVNNLGFNLYRDNGGKLEAVNSQLIAGSALMFASEIELRSGHAYEWWDSRIADCGLPVADCKSTTYWIEDRDLNGQSNWHGPFYPAPGSEKQRPASIQQAKTLAALGVNQSPSLPVESLARLPRSSSPLKSLAALPAPDPGSTIKLAIKREGWYRLAQAELIAAGLKQSTDPRLLQLFVDGKQQAIAVNGQDDGSLDPSDSIEFYATGIDSPFSDARTYYLLAGKQAGLRVSQIKSFAAPQPGGSFAYSVERRERSIYFAALRNGDRENFFGSVIASQPVNQPLTLPHVDSNSSTPALLKVVLQGVTNVDHIITIELNGSFAGQLRFSEQASGETTIEIPHSMLQEGANAVRLIPQGGPSDVSLVDSVRLTYQHTLVADDDSLRFTVSGGQPVTIEGFTNSAIRVFDVTDPLAVKEINGSVAKQGGEEQGGTLSVTFTAPGDGLRTLLVLTDARARQPDNVAADNPSNLGGAVQNATLLIVTPRDFVDQAGSLKSYRQAQGLSVEVVDIQDIYDEFSFGQKTPYALRDFFSHANRSWRTRYALLLGDSSFDSKNYLGLGDSDLVPTRLLDTLFMETASDDWLADFDRDGIADFAIGRIPARTTSEAETMIGKIYSYESSKSSDEALLVSDRNDGFNFEQANAQLIPLLPQGTRAIHVKRAQLGDSATKAAVVDGINRGQRVVSYAGHGSANVWRGNTLTATDAKLLENREQLTAFVIMNCLNGYFTDPATESLSEALMRNPNGGAVAAWASSAMTFADGQVSLSQEFYRQVFGGRARLGDAAIRAKSSTLDGDVRKTWILFGDPSMRMIR